MKSRLISVGKQKMYQFREGGLGEVITGQRKTIKLAVIGTGNHCRANLFPNLPFLPVKVISVFSAHIQNAEYYGKKYGAEHYYDNYRAMIEKEDLDLIICSVNAKEHPNVIRQSLKNNIPIFIEKPPAKTSAELSNLLNLEHSDKVMVGFQKRFVPNYQFIADAINSKKYGKLNYLQLEFGVGAYSADMAEFLLEIGIHFIDLVRYFLPDAQISEVRRNNSGNGRMNVSVSFHAEPGTIGNLLLSSNFDWSNCHERVFANFEKLNIVVENLVDLKITPNSKTVMNIPLEKVLRKKIYKKQWCPNYISSIPENSSFAQTGFFPELQYFVNSVANNKINKISDLNNAYQTTLMMEKILNV